MSCWRGVSQPLTFWGKVNILMLALISNFKALTEICAMHLTVPALHSGERSITFFEMKGLLYG